MSKLYGSYSDIEPYRETERNGSYADHVRRPVMVDPEGRKDPNMQYRPGYVMTTERVVEHVTRAPVISFIRPADHQGRPYVETGPNISRTGAADHPYWSNYGADHDEPEMDNYGYPQPNYGPKMENFITKIQTEVSKPQQPITKVPGPFTSNWRAAPTNNHSPADDDRHQIPKKIQNVPIGNPSPAPNKYNFYERPAEGPLLPARPLTRPTNDIHEAVEILTGGIRTLSRPSMGAPWRKGNSDEDDRDRIDHGPEKMQNQPRLGYDRVDHGPEKMQNQPRLGYDRSDHSPQKMQNPPRLGYGRSDHSPQKMQNQPRFGVPPPKEVISYSSGSDSDTIDSGEARKRHAKLKPQPVPEKAHKGAINSDDLIKKYNGTKVPW